jgi:hypothetical protein
MKQLAEAFGDRVFIAINDGMNGRPGVPYEESVVAAFETPGFSCPKPMAFDPGPNFDLLPQHLHLDQMEGIWIDRRGGYADTGAQFVSVAAARLAWMVLFVSM